MNKVILTLVTLFVLSIFPIYQLLALNNIQIQNFTIENFGMNNHLLFTVQGTGQLYNPSVIPVTIKEITYVGAIKNETVFEGTIAGMTIGAGEKVEFPFSEEIDWVPDQETVKEILAGENVTLIIHTKSRASYLYFFTLTGEKEVNISLTEQVKPYVEEQVALLFNKMVSFLI